MGEIEAFIARTVQGAGSAADHALATPQGAQVGQAGAQAGITQQAVSDARIAFTVTLETAKEDALAVEGVTLPLSTFELVIKHRPP